MKMSCCILILLYILFLSHYVGSQRTYSPGSVLASNNWYKLSVNNPGVYKIDIPFLNSLGINSNYLSSASIRLYGNGGKMLLEANAGLCRTI
jgi:hypothetical protein